MPKTSPPSAPEPGALSIDEARAARGDTPAPGSDPAVLAAPVDAPLTSEADPSADEQPQVPAPTWGRWLYSGPPGRCYTAVPVTPEPGDVVECWGPPSGDGCWESTDAEPTRMPDNWRPDPSDEEHARLRGDKTT